MRHSSLTQVDACLTVVQEVSVEAPANLLQRFFLIIARVVLLCSYRKPVQLKVIRYEKDKKTSKRIGTF